MPKTTFIYALCEPGTRTVRYIGKSDNPKHRFHYGHLLGSVKRTTHLGRWLQRVVKSEQTPNLVILAKVSKRLWQVEERRYIANARMLGMDLVNATDGGEGVTMTPQTRQKIGDKNRGRKRSLEYRQALRLATTGEKNHMFGRSGLACPAFGIKRKGASSKFFGVSWCSHANKWRVTLCCKHYGVFLLEIDAAKAYDVIVRKLYGPKARTNFPIKRRINKN